MIVSEKIKINEWGEVVSGEITQVRKVTAEEFCQVYLKDHSEFYKLSQAEHNVLAVCMYRATYYDNEKSKLGNIVRCDSLFIEDVANKTNLKVSTIKNAIVSLAKKDMLIKDSKHRAVYYLNPYYFFKGSLTDRTKVIRIITDYQINSTTTEGKQ